MLILTMSYEEDLDATQRMRELLGAILEDEKSLNLEILTASPMNETLLIEETVKPTRNVTFDVRDVEVPAVTVSTSSASTRFQSATPLITSQTSDFASKLMRRSRPTEKALSITAGDLGDNSHALKQAPLMPPMAVHLKRQKHLEKFLRFPLPYVFNYEIGLCH